MQYITPIKKVNYRVEDTMVGRVTNYDKLVLEIATDGSIEIQDALSYAVELLKIHVNPFTNIGNNMSNSEAVKMKRQQQILKLKII